MSYPLLVSVIKCSFDLNLSVVYSVKLGGSQ